MDEINITQNPQRKDNSSMVALVMGILSIVCGLTGMMAVGLVLGIIGIVQGNKNRLTDSEARAGFVCSIIGTALSGVFVLVVIAFFAAFGPFFPHMWMPMLFW
jgi:thiamine transporter ThiT